MSRRAKKSAGPFELYEGDPRELALVSVGFMNRILTTLNAIINARTTDGIKFTWADSGIVLGNDQKQSGTDSGSLHWLIVCRLDSDGQMRHYATAANCSKLYPVTSLGNGRYSIGLAPESGEPFSDDPLPS